MTAEETRFECARGKKDLMPFYNFLIKKNAKSLKTLKKGNKITKALLLEYCPENSI